LALENLAGQGKPLEIEAFDQQEYDGLVRSASVRLQDACNNENALESRFDLAYNAAHAFSLAALRRVGYRARNRYIVFQVLPHTLGLAPHVWRVLDKCHNLRNLIEYEGVADISEALAKDLLSAAQSVQRALLERYSEGQEPLK
jgi:hypothetical protein